MSAGFTGLRDESGHVLLAVTILIFVFVIIGSAFLALAQHETRATQQDLDSQRAFWLAEAGVAHAVRYLTQEFRPPTYDITIFQNQPGPDGGDYSVECLVDTTTWYSVEKAFMLDSIGRMHDRERRVRQRIKMISFAQYAYFTDDEYTPGGQPIWFFSTDVIEGRLHTNGTLRIAGNPRFRGAVTTVSDYMIAYPSYQVTDPAGWPAGGNNPAFEQGFEVSVANIPLPTRTADLRSEAQTGGVYVAPASEIELGVMGTPNPIPAPGWFRYRPLAPPNAAWTSVQIAPLAKKVFYCNNDLNVKGVLDGELTVSSDKNIWIVDDIRYQASDLQGTPLPNCNDLLGLVAGRNVIFRQNAANQADLIVDGVMMALDTSIYAENYASGAPRGILTVWGGLIQKYRGAVGTFSGSVIVSGYRKNYHYDTRVTARTPPSFPLTGVYEDVTWTETWDESDPF